MDQASKILSDVVAFRSYAKYLPHMQRRESFAETVNRTMNMHLDKFPLLSKDIIKAFGKVHNYEIMPALRTAQFAGEAIKKNNFRGYNCSYCPVSNVRVFGELLYLLLSGVGTGFSVQSHHINQLPKVRLPKEENFFAIHDSIIGWAQALDMLMEAYLYQRIRPVFDFSLIRAKGSYLSTTGAKAPGPNPLKLMLNRVEDKLKVALGRKLKSIEVHDIICIIADCVLSGGIRRAATISFFDKSDNDMLNCKKGDWWEHSPWRARANNSVMLYHYDITKEEFDHIFNITKESGSGEPGFFWSNDESKEWAANPCQPGYALLKTEKGITPMSGITIGDKIWDGCTWVVVINKVNTGVKSVYKYVTRNGGIFIGTKEHKVFENRKRVRVDDAKRIDTELDNGFYYPSEVQSVTYLEDTEVFDITVDSEEHKYWTDGCLVSNCVEISLKPQQLCNLSTINQTGVNSKKEFLSRIHSATLLGTLQASYTDFSYVRSKWQETTEQDALLGVSFTGISDAVNMVSPEWLEEGAKFAVEMNNKYAKKIGINPAARVTCIKPEGSASIVCGSASGIHARHSTQYLRRVRMPSNDALAIYLKYKIPELIEEDKFSANTSILVVPQKSPIGAINREQETAISLFDRALLYNKHWIAPGHTSGINKNNVSATISVKEDEWEALREKMWEERNNYTGISLLPYDGGSYTQAPFEECSVAVYEKYLPLLKEIDLREVKEIIDFTDHMDIIACGGGSCEIK